MHADQCKGVEANNNRILSSTYYGRICGNWIYRKIKNVSHELYKIILFLFAPLTFGMWQLTEKKKSLLENFTFYCDWQKFHDCLQFFYVWIKRAYLSICVAQLLKAVNYNQWQLTIIETIVVTSIIAAIWWKTVCTLWAVPVQYAVINDIFTVNNLLGWTWAIIYWNKIVMEMS